MEKYLILNYFQVTIKDMEKMLYMYMLGLMKSTINQTLGFSFLKCFLFCS